MVEQKCKISISGGGRKRFCRGFYGSSARFQLLHLPRESVIIHLHMVKKLLKGISYLCLYHYRKILLIFFIVFGIAFVLTGRIRFDPNFLKLFPVERGPIKLYMENLQEAGTFDPLFVLLENGKEGDPQRLIESGLERWRKRCRPCPTHHGKGYGRVLPDHHARIWIFSHGSVSGPLHHGMGDHPGGGLLFDYCPLLSSNPFNAKGAETP